MSTRMLKLIATAVLSFAVSLSPAAAQSEAAKDTARADGVVRVKSAYPLDETIARRHGIDEADQQPFKTASEVIASITTSIRTR